MSRFRQYSKHFLVASLVLFLFACGGGSCSSCAGCGVAPIPGGFPIAERIDNSAQVRLTSSGIGFIESHITDIIGTLMPTGLTFAVPPTVTSVSGVPIELCASGNCKVQATIDAFDLTAVTPNRLTGHMRMILDSRDLAGARAGFPLRIGPYGCLFGACIVDTTCSVDIDTTRGSRNFIGIVFNVDFTAETQPARAGYTKIVITNATLAPGEEIEDADINLDSCSGVVGWIINLVVPLIKGTLVSQIQGQIPTLLNSALGDALCMKRGDYGCPTGTFSRPNEDPASTCRYENTDAAECVPILLGTDGQGDLGAAFLGGFSPGTHGSGQFMLASGGDGEAVDDGMSLFFYGGFRSTNGDYTVSPGHNACVPALTPTSPRVGGGTIADNWGGGERPTIDRVDTFRSNTPAGLATPPHVSIGLSQDYLNYAAFGAFDAGLLCIGAGTRLSQQISTGLFSILIGSLKNLSFPEEAAALAFAIRPQEPPRVTVGTAAGEPTLALLLPSVQVDFYVWSNERYVRIMTYQADLNVTINLTVEAGQIVPSIGALTASNPVVTNSDLITENTVSLAETITTVLGSFAGSLGSGLSPIAIPSVSGFDLTIPPGGLTGIEDSSGTSGTPERFLGIFANLAMAAPAAVTMTTDTTLAVQDLVLNREGMTIEHFGQGATPSVRLNLNATGPAAVDFEYSYRIDGMQWSPWTRDRSIVVESTALLFQARHEIEARSRVVGEVLTTDLTPARAELLIDILAPDVVVEQEGNTARIIATDVITSRSALFYRYRTGSGAWTEWTHDATYVLPDGGATGLDVEVKDEAGNVGASRQALIRGLPNPGAAAGCGCRVADGPSGGDFAIFAVVLVLLGAGRRRSLPGARRFRAGKLARAALKHLPLVLVLATPLALGAMGCDCGGKKVPPVPPPCDALCEATPTDGQFCCATTNMCQTFGPEADCSPGFTCPPESIELDGCTVVCAVGACIEKPPLTPGQLATHLDMVLDESGVPTLSGYSPGNPPTRYYGDLVVGAYDAASETVDWEIVDGAPTSPIVAGPSGWRGGVSAAGPDVGRFTSIARSSSGTLYVSYYDADDGNLKLAIRSGSTWSTQVVDESGDAGRYSSLVLTSAGVPVVAYMRINPPEGNGRPTSGVFVATAANAAPADPTDWTITNVVSGEMACRPQFCGAGQTCLESGECVTPSTDCTTACSDTQACVAGACAAALANPWIEDLPPAIGLHNSLAVTATGYGLVYYDRNAGNLQGVVNDGTAWGTPFLIDGYAAGSPFIGDSGIGASLFVDAAGKWHVSYVDGAEEKLKYARISGTTVEVKEVVDDGATDGTTPNPDGRHVVGDDSSIVVTDGGEVRIAYQDATVQRVMFATRAAAGGWTLTVLDAVDSTGYFVDQVLLANTSYVATWWRREQGTKANGVRILNP
jgi:MYXO-CTERM domain-containing protein